MESFELCTFETIRNTADANIDIATPEPDISSRSSILRKDTGFVPFMVLHKETGEDNERRPTTGAFRGSCAEKQPMNTERSFTCDVPTAMPAKAIPPPPAPVPNHQFPIHTTIQQKLDMFYDTQKIPHIIFHGASGTGKLTLVQEFIRKIYNGDKQRLKQNVMMVNCSHGKGIKFIREELKFFAKTNIQSSSGVLFKTIVLINAHHLTIDAQSALRRCIELFSYNTRFFMLLENKDKLLKPILSRFCEIYVPEYTNESNNIINLHEHSLRMIYGESSQRRTFRECIHSRLAQKLYQKYNTNDYQLVAFSATSLAEIAEDFYYQGISALNVVDWLNEPSQKNLLTDVQHANSMMCFYRVKSEFRCEKMLLFYLLHFVFCSDFELPIA
jgi:hypothetical protein